MLRFRHNKGRFIAVMLLLGTAIGIALPLFLGVELGLALALALGVPSLIYGSVQFADASDTIGKLVELEEALRSDTHRLEQQLSTKQLGNAPDFISQIIEMLSRAKRRVTICCDFPAYGALTDPGGYARYVSAIRHLRRDVEIKLLHLDEAAQRGIARDGYRCNGHKTATGDFVDDEDGFLQRIATENERALKEQFRDAEKHKTSFVMPLFFWIVDNEAVFALRRITEAGDVEVGFQTSDKTLVDALGDIFLRYIEMGGQFELVSKNSAAMAAPVVTG